MKQSKDPFEAAFEEQEDSPPESPAGDASFDTQNPNSDAADPQSQSQSQPQDHVHDDESGRKSAPTQFTPGAGTSSGGGAIATTTTTTGGAATKNKEEDDEEEEENMEVELGKFPSGGDPDRMATMQAILSQFTEEQMSRYESFRRAGFQKSNMKRTCIASQTQMQSLVSSAKKVHMMVLHLISELQLLVSITGTQKISVPMTIVVSGIAKMFVGEVVETARMVMKERKESGPIRPSHLREAYRRLKLEGKVFKRSGARLFR